MLQRWVLALARKNFFVGLPLVHTTYFYILDSIFYQITKIFLFCLSFYTYILHLIKRDIMGKFCHSETKMLHPKLQPKRVLLNIDYSKSNFISKIFLLRQYTKSEKNWLNFKYLKRNFVVNIKIYAFLYKLK